MMPHTPVHSHECKTSVTEVYRYFVSKGIINHKQLSFTSAIHVLHYVIITTRVQIKMLSFVFLPDALAVRLIGTSLTFKPLQAPVVAFTHFCQSIAVTKQANLIIEGSYDLMC